MPPSQAEKLNQRYGRELFATRLDDSGLPVGGFAVPTITVTVVDEENPRVRVAVGTYRVVNGRVDPHSVVGYVSVVDCGFACGVPEKTRAEMFEQLVASLP